MSGLYEARPLTPEKGFTEGIEGPACDAHGNLYACNFEKQGRIGVVTPEGASYAFADCPAGSTPNGMRFWKDGSMLLADYTGHNILRLDMRSRKCAVLAHGKDFKQPNDLAVGKSGLIFASDPDWKAEKGQVWLCQGEGKLKLAAKGMGTTNGIEVAPTEKTLYVNESVQRRIWAFDLSAKGALTRKRKLIEFPDFGLDGMRCDIKGNLYVTRYGKGSIAVLSPKGRLLREVALSGAKPSNLAFGGPDGCTVFVTEVEKGRIEAFQAPWPGREWRLSQD